MKKIIFSMIIILTGLFDFITFYINKSLHIFEINPIYVLTGSILFLTLLKFGVIAFIVWFICSKTQKTYFSSFFYILCGVLLIVAQIFGGVSNLKVQSEQPPPELAMQPQEAVATYINISIFLFYLPMILSLVSFKVWEYIYIKDKVQLI